MKNHYLITFLILLFGITISSAQSIAVPDDNFENYLETHTANGSLVNIGDPNSMGDGMINNAVLISRITNVVSLDVSNQNISDLTGIEWFSSLETLICSNNNLPSLNVSSNSNLVSLLCGSNLLTTLNINSNSNLETLNCSDNQIQNLDVSSNTALKSISCSSNQLSQLDLNSNLNFLSVSNNRLTTLNVSNNNSLESLFCASNQISILNLSANSNLKNLDASSNLLVNLDLSAINTVVCPNPQTNPLTVCQGSSTINVSQNKLISINISNGYNNLITSFNSEDNPDLFCIQTDIGFVPNSDWLKDDWTYYTDAACSDIYTYVPDDNFENYLETHDANGAVVVLGSVNSMGDGIANNNFVLTSRVDNVLVLNVANQNIDDLTGIEDFLEITDLICASNNLKELNVDANIKLISLNCSNNILPSLNTELNTVIENIDCSFQQPYVDPSDSSNNYEFTSLNLSSNTTLLTLNCSNNFLVDIDLSNNSLLNSLDCSFNQLENLNLSVNTNLTSVLCNNNGLSALNVQNGTNVSSINSFNAENNPNLFCIEVDDITFSQTDAGWLEDDINYYSLGCGTYVPDDNFENYLETHDANGAVVAIGNAASMGDGIANNNYVFTNRINAVVALNVQGLGIMDLTGIEDFSAIQDLNCSNNSITTLDLSPNISLTTLDCSNNQIEQLDFTVNTALTTLLCNDNTLRNLNIRNGSNNLISSFNATANTSLFCINVDDAIVGTNPAGWLKDGFASYNGDCDNNRFTSIPDNNFEQALIDLGLDSGPLDNQVLTSNIEHVLSLDVSGKQIESLIGIKAFTLLNSLDCSSNYLSDLDVSGMSNLEELYCSSNYFLTNNIANVTGLLNTTGTINLKKLFCSSNNLSDLDVSNNLNLEELDCADNNLSVLDISGNGSLIELNCSNNNLSNLDISNNNTLEVANCDSNKIMNLTVAASNNTLTNLSCANNEIGTLLLNNYTALDDLNCRSNALTQLNVDSSNVLEILDFSDNQIGTINLTNNINLIILSASQNNLSQLDVTTNTSLESLKCDYNQITQLDVSALTLLRYLSGSNNQLTSLNTVNNTNLIELNLSNNLLVSLQLSNNLNQLKTFNCSNNAIEGGFDLSTIGTGSCPATNPKNQQDYCPDSITINISNNALEFVNIQNGINNNIGNFNASLNPSLDCIQVDDANNIGANWQKDVTTEYSLDCRFGETYVPDDNFEQALINLGYDSAPLDDYVSTATIEVLLTLNVSGNGISDLTGIEDFEALENLDCSNNNLANIDLSENLSLTQVNCSSNAFSTLDFSNNTALTDINCSGNTLNTLDLTNNLNVTNLNISGNQFSIFNPSLIPTLQIFNCDSNQLVDLDFSLNNALTNLSCISNVLETLSVKNGANASLINLDAQNNSELFCIETDTGAVPGGVTWLKDTQAQFSVDCHYGETYVPDDAFEQALISFGLDSGPLDDYVVTSNIDGLSILNVNSLGISDLTGIEDFISLTILSFEGNKISNVNLNENILLENLDASNNVITSIDVSQLTNLKTLDLSNNTLNQIDLSANINLLDLNVSNNNLSILNIDSSINLVELDCSYNNLGSLSVTQNSSLTKILCQSNSFISDQLNLKNGANQNIQIFNATLNPNLICILVDNPFEVISNTNGTYDNWFKDTTANYQSVCDDADNDGVSNADDNCPNTPFGEQVDLFGCSILSLPNDNFTVLITGETCLNNNDGKINITTKEHHIYNVNLKGDDFDKDYTFTNEIDILNLLAGTYKLCITLDEWPNFRRCFNVVINHPENLEVISSKGRNSKQASFNLSGSTSYNVNFNGLMFSTSESNLTLQLQNGANTIKISTDLNCQGTHEENIFVSDEMFVYPNPFQNNVNVYLGELDDEHIEINVYSYLGQLVYSKEIHDASSRSLNIKTQDFASGLYTMFVKSSKSISTFKIVKK